MIISKIQINFPSTQTLVLRQMTSVWLVESPATPLPIHIVRKNCNYTGFRSNKFYISLTLLCPITMVDQGTISLLGILNNLKAIVTYPAIAHMHPNRVLSQEFQQTIFKLPSIHLLTPTHQSLNSRKNIPTLSHQIKP